MGWNAFASSCAAIAAVSCKEISAISIGGLQALHSLSCTTRKLRTSDAACFGKSRREHRRRGNGHLSFGFQHRREEQSCAMKIGRQESLQEKSAAKVSLASAINLACISALV